MTPMERDRTGRLVGRDLELDTFDRLLARLGEGFGGELVLVTGEPGIRQSSLLAEIAHRAERSGLRVLRGGCWEGGAPSYWPWRQILRSLGDQDLQPAGGPVARLLHGTRGP